MTRALHLLLNGDFIGAIYFNWLAFPFLGAVIFLFALFAIEIAKRRVIWRLRMILPVTRRATNGIWAGLIVALDAANLSRRFATQARTT